MVLSDAGLAAAVRALAETRDLRIDVVTDRRFPAVVEATAYLLFDRARSASPAVVSATANDDELAVRVHVDGPAPDLGDLANRALTLGGELRDLPGSSGCEVVLVLPLLRRDAPAGL